MTRNILNDASWAPEMPGRGMAVGLEAGLTLGPALNSLAPDHSDLDGRKAVLSNASAERDYA